MSRRTASCCSETKQDRAIHPVRLWLVPRARARGNLEPTGLPSAASWVNLTSSSAGPRTRHGTLGFRGLRLRGGSTQLKPSAAAWLRSVPTSRRISSAAATRVIPTAASFMSSSQSPVVQARRGLRGRPMRCPKVHAFSWTPAQDRPRRAAISNPVARLRASCTSNATSVVDHFWPCGGLTVATR